MRAAPQLVVVQHEPIERHLLVTYLGQQGFRVTGFDRGTAVPPLLRRAPPDLLVLDMQLPGEDSVALIRTVGEQQPQVGIIMISEAGAAGTCVRGLDAGGDDCIVKPFDPRELMARVRSVLRRVRPAAQQATPTRLRVGRCLLDLDRRELLDGDAAEPLEGMDFALLRAFAANPNRPLEPQWLAQVAATRAAARAPSIASRVEALRRRIEHDPAHPLVIRTVAGIGYMFVPDAGERVARLG
jgi:DNA-binding response OmpR family regulator